MSLRAALKSGHPGTLVAAFLYFDFCFAIWVLNGAMGPFLTQSFHLSAAQTGFMVSIPTLAGALMRFPLGVLSQYIGRKNAAILEMSLIIVAMLYGWLFVHSFTDVMLMGILLGIAGASFGVALALAAGWFPPENKGLAMGHCRRRQCRHRHGAAHRAASGGSLWMAHGLYRRCGNHAVSRSQS